MTLPNQWNLKYNVLLKNWNLKSQVKNINTHIQQVYSQGNSVVLQNAQTLYEWKS